MDKTFDLYRDIAERTDGDVYIGVVGPVRTGKSTLIARMMESSSCPPWPPARAATAFRTSCPRAAAAAPS